MNSYLNIRINGKNLEKKEDIENAILKFNEDLNRNAKIDEMLNKINFLLEKMDK